MQESSALELTRCECWMLLRIFLLHLYHKALEEEAGRGKKKEETGRGGKERKSRKRRRSCKMQESPVLELTRCECLLLVRIFLQYCI